MQLIGHINYFSKLFVNAKAGSMKKGKRNKVFYIFKFLLLNFVASINNG